MSGIHPIVAFIVRTVQDLLLTKLILRYTKFFLYEGRVKNMVMVN